MAWTVSRQGCMIELIPDGSNNFLWSDRPDIFPAEGVLVEEIQVYFSAASDELEMRTHSTTGPHMFKYTTLDGSSVAKRFFRGLFKPVIVHSEQVYSNAANWLILIQTTG